MHFELNVEISIEGYADLCTALNHYVNRIRVNPINNGKSITFMEEFGNLKKPCKKMHGTLLKRRKKPFDLGNSTTCQTFFRITTIPYVGNETFQIILSAWNLTGLPNRFRTFILRFYNNTLGINTRLSHFVNNRERFCTFCNIKNEANLLDETFLHLFLECKYTREWHNFFY